MKQVYIIYRDENILETGRVSPANEKMQNYINELLNNDSSKKVLYLDQHEIPDISKYKIKDEALVEETSDFFINEKNRIDRETNIKNIFSADGLTADTDTLVRLLVIREYLSSNPDQIVNFPFYIDNNMVWKELKHNKIDEILEGLGAIVIDEYNENFNNDI